MKKNLLLVMSLFSISACATVFDGATQKIKVEVVNVSDNKLLKGARCTATDEMESIYIVSDNPGTLKIKKGQGVLQFDCKKPGYVQKNTDIQEYFNNTAFFNIFTLGAGFFVDAVSGAILEYPSHVIIKMEEDRY